MPLWLWGVAIIVVLGVARFVVNRWLTATMGVRTNPAMLERAQGFMLGVQHADQLIMSGEVGQAMLVLDELALRPEIHEVPALAAQIQLNRARVASTLQRYDDALTAGVEAIAFYRQAYRRFRNSSNTSNLGEALQVVAQIHLRKDDVPRAIEAFTEIRAVNRRAAFRQTLVRTELELARLHLQIDDYGQAAFHAKEGYALARKWNMGGHAVEALDFQAMAVASAGDLAEAHRLLDVSAAQLGSDAPLSLRAHYLVTREALAADEGDLHTQVTVGGELLFVVAALKAGRGWRQDQSETISQFVEQEQRTLEAAYTLAEQGDAQAASVYVGALGSLRESEIANLLRSGLLDADTEPSGLPAVIADLFAQLARAEDPDTPAARSPVAVYERLETAVSSRFRQLVQAPTSHREWVVPRYHHVQVRLIENTSGSLTLYGSWEAPGHPAVLFSNALPAEVQDSLLAVTGMADSRRPPTAAQEPGAVRASVKGWPVSRQFRALSGHDDSWRSLASSLLPPELLDLVRAVPPNADDDTVPLIVFSPDSLLWALPWAALTIDDSGTLLGDRAATALLPSSSLLRAEPSPLPHGSRVLTYLHGVHAAGLSLERSAVAAAWPERVDEATDAAALVHALADTTGYALLTMSVHGDDRPGLAHALLLDPDRKTRLSAARMMGLTFPRTVVVGACFSGSLDKRVGTDPVGIPSVMLCRGASTVIGGSFPLPDGPGAGHATATVLGHFYALHAQGARAPWALRRAQQRWRAEHDTSPYSWAGLTALTNCDLD
jgi:hypothetical protein